MAPEKIAGRRRWLSLLAVLAFGVSPPAIGARCDEAGDVDHSREIEQLRISLAQRLSRLDEDVLDMNRRLRREHEQVPIRLNTANEEAKLVRKQLRAVEAAYAELLEHADRGDLPRARGAFVEGLLAMECARLRMKLVDDLLQKRRPWYPEGVSVWTRDIPSEPAASPSFEAPDWPPPDPPERLGR